MTTPEQIRNARFAADAVFAAGLRPDDIRQALAAHPDAQDALVDRLAAIASLSASGETTADDVSVERLDALVARAMDLYDSIDSAVQSDLSAVKTWRAAGPVLGIDMPFLIKLFERRVTMPGRRFLQDASDALGVSVEALGAYFALDPAPSGAGVERKGSGAETGPVRENFADAVKAAQVSDDVKARWLDA
jgi:hypothetical protein